MAKNEELEVAQELSTPEDAQANAVEAAKNRKGKQVGATVSAEYFDGLEDHRWAARRTITEVVKEALDDYVAKHGIKVDGSAPHAY